MPKFTELLEEYLTERDRQNSNYYDDRYFGDRTNGRYRMEDLAEEMDDMFKQLTTDRNI